MKPKKYHEILPISRSDAEQAFLSSDPEIICDALIRVVFHNEDWRWVEDLCIELLSHREKDVQALTVTCFGHLARIHRKLSVDKIRLILTNLLDDPYLGGQARDALDDIEKFIEKEIEN